jgi:hypothetical protein
LYISVFNLDFQLSQFVIDFRELKEIMRDFKNLSYNVRVHFHNYGKIDIAAFIETLWTLSTLMTAPTFMLIWEPCKRFRTLKMFWRSENFVFFWNLANVLGHQKYCRTLQMF